MRIALGTTILNRARATGTLDGIASYTRELEQRLSLLDGLQVTPFTFFQPDKPSGNVVNLDFGHFGRQILFSVLTGLPFVKVGRQVAGHIDLVHATDHLIPLLQNMPVIATIHDAIPLVHPEWVGYSMGRIKNWVWRRSARWATHVITISNHSKQELIRWFGLPEQRISIVPQGVDQRWMVTPSMEKAAMVSYRYALPERYFLCVGTLQPRKNVMRLIAAHRALPQAYRADFPLVVVGRAGWQCHDEVQALQEGEGGMLRWLGHVADDDLHAIMHSAQALVFPSLHEGFGLPVLEAFAAGTPVVTSKTTSLPEVAGDAALLVDPLQVGEIAQAMRALIDDPALAARLSWCGKKRGAAFTWERTAAMTATIYRQIGGAAENW